MAKSRRNITNKGASLYNKILKEFTVINNQLPEDRRLSLSERRRYISKSIYPQYKGSSPSRVGKKAISVSIFQVLNTLAPKEECNPNYVSPSVYDDVDWFSLDEFIQEVLPKCINMKVSGSEFGDTKIFNTMNYTYEGSGVKSIIDGVRDYVENKSGGASFSGVKRLRKGKTNDGTPENYYIDMVLVLDDIPTSDLTPIIYNVPKEEKKVVTSVKKAILERVKQLNLKKKRRTNARKTARKNIAKITQINKRQRKSNNPKFKSKLSNEKEKQYVAMQRQLDNALNKGLLTQEQYDRFSLELTKRVLDNRKDGGLI